MVEGSKEDEKWKRRSAFSSLSLSWFSVIHVFYVFTCTDILVTLVTSLRGADFWSCVSLAKRWCITQWLAMISERGVLYGTKRTGPSTEPWGTPMWTVMVTKMIIDWSRIFAWEIWLKPLEYSRLNAKNRVQMGEENSVVNSVESSRIISPPPPPPPKKKKKTKRRREETKKNKKRKRKKCCHCPERREYRYIAPHPTRLAQSASQFKTRMNISIKTWNMHTPDNPTPKVKCRQACTHPGTMKAVKTRSAAIHWLWTHLMIANQMQRAS